MIERSVSHGTLKPFDLLSAFEIELEKYYNQFIDNDHYDILCQAEEFLSLLEDEEFLDLPSDMQEKILECIADLEAAINNYVPKSYYFGSHPGDGSDIGYWKLEEETI